MIWLASKWKMIFLKKKIYECSASGICPFLSIFLWNTWYIGLREHWFGKQNPALCLSQRDQKRYIKHQKHHCYGKFSYDSVSEPSSLYYPWKHHSSGSTQTDNWFRRSQPISSFNNRPEGRIGKISQQPVESSSASFSFWVYVWHFQSHQLIQEITILND